MRSLIPFRVRLGAPIAVALGLAAATPASSCPANEYAFNGATYSTIISPTFDLVLSPTRQVGYDMFVGTLRLRHDGKFGSFVRVRDTFTVGGLAPGTVVPLVVELDVDATIGTPGCGGSNCWGYMTAQITRGSDVATASAQENIWGGPPRPVPRVVRLPLDFVVGQPETIEFALYGSGSSDHQTTADGVFHFVGLPAGATITSCQGYVEAPTPAQAASWGGVKATYR